MIGARHHGAVWLVGGLWAGALALDIGILAATLSTPAQLGEALSTEVNGENGSVRSGVPGREQPARPVEGSASANEAKGEGARAGPSRDRGYDRAPGPDQAPGAAAAESPGPAGPPGGRLDPVVHTVARGETLISILRGYTGTSSAWREVATANGIEPPHVLKIGLEVRIPMAKIARTEARAVLEPPREPRREEPAVGVLETDMNPPPPGALLPPEKGLRVVHPVWEAFPWRMLMVSAAGFVAAVIAAAAVAITGTAGPVDPSAAARALGWAAVAAGGAFALVGGAAALAAEAIAGSVLLQWALAIGTGGCAGAAAYFGGMTAPQRERRSRLGPRTPGPLGRGRGAPLIARRFGVAVGALVMIELLCASAAGWLAPALLALRLPG